MKPRRLTPDQIPPGAASGAATACHPPRDVLSQALAYARAGWPVFPCRTGAKEPDTPHGFKDATTDPGQIHAWWQDRPDRNVAVATGAPGPDVLDVDVKPDGNGMPAFERLKRAGLLTGARAIVRTRSGGLHVYFSGTGQACGRLPARFLDFKAVGGYVLAPPSMVGGRRYELLDHRGGADARLEWQAATRLLDPPKPPARLSRHDSGDLGKLAAWVAGLREGNRNDGLFWAACRAVETGHSDLGGLVAAAVRAGLDEDEALRTVASAVRRAGQ